MQQRMTLRKSEPLVIETPLGLIEIHRGDGAHKVVLTLPAGLTAQRGIERALSAGRFVARHGDGQMRPRYQMLVPVTGADGELKGVDTPPVFKIAKTG